MHIPNGFIDPKMATGLGLASAGALAYCFAKVKALVASPVLKEALAGVGKTISSISGKARSSFGDTFIIKMGAVASLIFAAQMFNFPVAQGTSGHLLGGVLAAVILGPWAGTIVISAILTIQSLFFADGGILVLGVNIFNMAIIGSIGGYYIYYGTKRLVGFFPGAAIAAWLSVVAAAAATALELGLSGTFELIETMKAMLSVHAIIGIAEAAITIAVLGLIMTIDRKLIEAFNNNE